MKILRKDLIHGQAFKYLTDSNGPRLVDDKNTSNTPPSGLQNSYTIIMSEMSDGSLMSEVELMPHPETGYYRIPRRQVRVGDCFRYINDKIKYCRVDQSRSPLPKGWCSAAGDGTGLILGDLVELIPNWNQPAGFIPSPYLPVSMPNSILTASLGDPTDFSVPIRSDSPNLYDGITKEECLRRFDEACRHDWIRKDNNGNLHVPRGGFTSLTVLQTKAAINYRKEILRLRVKQSADASRERNRLQVVCDSSDLDEYN